MACLNVGCIPSKALPTLLKQSKKESALFRTRCRFDAPKTDIDKIRIWKDKVISQLTGGLAGMAKGRKVNVVNGEARFTGSHTLSVEGSEGTTTITFENANRRRRLSSNELPLFHSEDPRVWDSTDALN